MGDLVGEGGLVRCGLTGVGRLDTFALVTGHLASGSFTSYAGWSGGRLLVVVPTTGQT